jgi:hypothetical protein
LRRRQRREYLISPRSSQRKVNRWFGHNAQQNRAEPSVWKYMPVSFLLKIHSSRSNSRSRRLRVVVRDNGCGIDPQVRSSRHPHWGLLGMRERAANSAIRMKRCHSRWWQPASILMRSFPPLGNHANGRTADCVCRRLGHGGLWRAAKTSLMGFMPRKIMWNWKEFLSIRSWNVMIQAS